MNHLLVPVTYGSIVVGSSVGQVFGLVWFDFTAALVVLGVGGSDCRVST